MLCTLGPRSHPLHGELVADMRMSAQVPVADMRMWRTDAQNRMMGGLGKGQPRSAQEAWEAHMKAMEVPLDAPGDGAGADEAPSGEAMMGGPRLAAKLDKR